MTHANALVRPKAVDKSPVVSSITIKCIRTLPDFEAIRAAWEFVYERDRYSQVFLTWNWLRGWFEHKRHDWVILVAYAANFNQPIGFLPLQHKHPGRLSIPFEAHLSMAGNPEADYTGLLCLPEAETAVIAAFADYLWQQSDWKVLLLKDVRDPRFTQLVDHFPAACDVYRYQGPICPYVNLPNSWEDYLVQQVSTSQRKRLRKALKDMENDSEVSINQTTIDSFEVDFDSFSHVYQLRHGQCTKAKMQKMREFARWGIQQHILRLYIFRKAGQPLAGEMLLLDQKNQCLRGYQRGYDPQFSRLSPGHGAVAYVMRSAIESGLTQFDFLRGDEGYKSKFGTSSQWTSNFLIVRSRRSRWLRKILLSILGAR
jgi:CelD/BcsL family acetyltransferase involved in cellulose biosynthesis